MVNFRYHVVSLVAVFLALALGILMGTTVISENLVNQLRRDARHFADRSSELRGQVDVLEGDITFLRRFGDGIVPTVVSRRLQGKQVVLLIQDRASDDVIVAITGALQMAGVPKPAMLRMTKTWSLTDEADRDRLALAVSSTSKQPDALAEQSAGALAARIVSPSDPKQERDLLRRLADAGFLKLDDLPQGAFPAPGAALVVVASGDADALPSYDRFFKPLLKGIQGRRPLVIAEGQRATDSIATRVRGDGDLNDAIGTVDHADTAAGQISLVWAVQAAVEVRQALHLGTGDGATGIMPVEFSKP